MEVNSASVKPDVLPTADAIANARSKLLMTIPDDGIGFEEAKRHLNEDIVPGLNGNSLTANYYGFVTGGATPAAAFADNLVTHWDQNVQVHLPEETIATDVEDRALRLLCDLIKLDPEQWSHRTFTTGATASNLVGLACGREYVIQEAARRRGQTVATSEVGLLEAVRAAGLDSIQILTTVAHSSLRKSASIVGLGRNSVQKVSREDAPHKFDLARLESLLATPCVASIVAISCAEVNTGLFATDRSDGIKIRELCDKYGAWIHVDAAFGLLARALPDTSEYSLLHEGVHCLEIADSITGDAHKLINVPYDCGIFLSRDVQLATRVFQNPSAAYLTPASPSPSTGPVIQSPLNIGIENSRRFRALPVYSTLVAYGAKGYQGMLERQIALSRAIAKHISEGNDYELLPQIVQANWNHVYIIVLFRAKDETINKNLVQRLNGTRKLYVSGTQWDGAPAARFAVSNWQVDVERDMTIVTLVLADALQ
ncbi:Alpha-methyldopa hypersensitive protein [Acrodontium crateriforme]|uniref:Alpha-methyldopa hypersensitive protein n=1 Tax=Acrodontium crateriforme TaxID=150365 RepID=A0AAQ3RC33_9PEZI|nr:Alpha-methyldopa hypersensitive protein [Acrodontium crateriforme]